MKKVPENTCRNYSHSGKGSSKNDDEILSHYVERKFSNE